MNSSSQRLALPLRWLARFTGLLSMGVLLLFMTGEDGLLSPQAWAKVRPAEWVLIFFFPFGILVGLALAWWREALGAVVAAGSLAAFYVSEAVLFGRLPGGPWFLILTAPAGLFLASWFAHKQSPGKVQSA